MKSKVNNMNKESKQQGFALVLVIALVIIVVGGIGWYVWSRNSNQIANNQPTSQTTPATYDPSENGKYLVIKEWGLRVKLDEKINGLKYKISENAAALFVLDRIKEIPGCDDVDWAGGIDRGKMGDPIGSSTVEQLSSQENKPLIQVDEFYYLYIGPQENCAASLPADPGCSESSTNYPKCLNLGTEEDNKKVEDITKSLFKAYQTIEKVPDDPNTKSP